MTPLDLGALGVIAGRVLGLDAMDALDLMDVAAAEAALAEAEAPGPRPGRASSAGTGSGDAASDPADRAAGLLSALIRHRPLPRGNERAAMLAIITFLAINGWQVDLEPAADHGGPGRRPGRRTAVRHRPRGVAGPPDLRLLRTSRSPVTSQGGSDAWMAAESEAEHPAQGGPTFRRFSPRAREVVISAQQEARALHHGYIGTEHLLLGLLAGTATGWRAGPCMCWGSARRPPASRSSTSSARARPSRPRAHPAARRGAKKVLELAVREARPPRSPARGHRAPPARPGARGRRGRLACAAPPRR